MPRTRLFDSFWIKVVRSVSHTLWGGVMDYATLWQRFFRQGCSFYKPVVPKTVAPAYSNDPLASAADILAGEFKAIA
jgi:hypothetical protein